MITPPPHAKELVPSMATELMTTTDLGALNARRLADAILASGAISRAQLSRDTGLSKPTVSIVLARLEASGIVREVGRTQGGRGATALLYALVPEAGSSLALDVGRRWIRARVTDLAGHAQATSVQPTAGTGAVALGRQLVAISRQVLDGAGVTRGRLVAATLGVPGVVVPERDRVRLAPRMPGLQKADVVERLRESLGVPVRVENDVNLAARAELALGHGRVQPDFVYLSVGTGVGLALVLGGELRTGASGSAGEVGYLPLLGTGVTSAVHAGRPGPFETLVAADGIVQAARTKQLKARTAQQVVQAARDGDARGIAVLTDQAELLAAGVATICAIVDPGLVVLGGGLGLGAADVLLPLLHKALRQLTPLRPTVVASQLADHAVLDGAAVDALECAQDLVLGEATGHHRRSMSQEAP